VHRAQQQITHHKLVHHSQDNVQIAIQVHKAHLLIHPQVQTIMVNQILKDHMEVQVQHPTPVKEVLWDRMVQALLYQVHRQLRHTLEQQVPYPMHSL